MSETIAKDLLASAGLVSVATETALKLIAIWGTERVHQFIDQIKAGGPGSVKARKGLQVRLLCCSNALLTVLSEGGVRTDSQTIWRAVKQHRQLAEALKRIVGNRCRDGDMDFVRAAVMDQGGDSGLANSAPPMREKDGRSGSSSPDASVERTGTLASGEELNASEPIERSCSLNSPTPLEASSRGGMHIYGGRGALAFEPCKSRAGKLALSVDAAVSTGVRQYNWREKIVVQLTEKEMLLLYAVLRGYLTHFEATAHGEANDKSFFIENQGHKFYVKVAQKGRPMVALPVEPPDAAMLTLALGDALVKSQPVLASIEGLDKVVEPMTRMLTSSQAGSNRQAA